MQLTNDVYRRLDYAGAVSAELRTENRLLPPRWGDVALRGNEEAVTAWLRSAARRKLEVIREDYVMARKNGRGARPLAIMGLLERLLYRATTALIDEEVVVTPRDSDAYDSFRRSPLQVADCAYVLRTDVAAFYQYVDHERLIDEVVAQTGDDLAVSDAVALLQHSSGRRFGLPQISPVSDVLADVYIDPMRRVLVRSGFKVSRFADDFRVACLDYEEALAALEVAERAARELGLILNEEKTSTPSRAVYEASLTALADRETEVFASLDAEVESFDVDIEYGDTVVAAEPVTQTLDDIPDFAEEEELSSSVEDAVVTVDSNQVLAAREVINRWVEKEKGDLPRHSEDAKIDTSLLRKALRVLRRAEDGSALQNIPALLVYEASLTPAVCSYLRSLMINDRLAVRRTLDEVCSSGIISVWQALWMSFTAGELPRRRGGDDFVHVNWLKVQASSAHPALAAEAILALSRRRLTSMNSIEEVMVRLPPVHRSTAVLAAAASGNEVAANGAAEGRLDKIRVDWALQRWS